MVSLVARTPLEGLLPVTIGDVKITEEAIDNAWFVSPLRGQEKAVTAALKDALGLTFPKPNRVAAKGDARAIWTGPGQALVLADHLPDLPGAAVTDQSDAFACASISGPSTLDVLARLVPIDLRPGTFKTGHTARTLLGHMTASVSRTGADTIEVMVFRSMAETLVEELERCAKAVAARP